MKKPKSEIPAGLDVERVEPAMAPENDDGTPSNFLTEDEIFADEEAPKADPKKQITELEAIAANLPEKMDRLSALEKLKAKCEKEIADLNVDLLAPDAEEMLRTRWKQEHMIEMASLDIDRLTDPSASERSRMRTLISNLKDTIQEAIGRETDLLREEIRALAKSNPTVSFLFDDLDPTDGMIAALPIACRPDRILSVAWNFASNWKYFEADRLVVELPKFIETAKRVVCGERLVALPSTD